MNQRIVYLTHNSRKSDNSDSPYQIPFKNNDSVQASQDHAEILLSHFSSAYQTSNCTDVDVICDGHLIIKAHRTVLAAFSTAFESVLRIHDFRNPIVNLEIDSNITGVSANDLTSIIDFFYTGKIHLANASIIDSFRSLGCQSVMPLLSQLEQEIGLELTLDYSIHSEFFISALEKFTAEGAFYDCILTFQNCSINCHRLVICAFSEILEDVLKPVTNHKKVILDVNSIAGIRDNGISSQDMRIIVDWCYTGKVNAMRKRFLSLREAARLLGIRHLYDVLTNELEVSKLQHTFQHEHRLPNRNIETVFHETDIPAPHFAEDYSKVYNTFVDGPERGKKLFGKAFKKRTMRKSKEVIVEMKHCDSSPTAPLKFFSQSNSEHETRLSSDDSTSTTYDSIANSSEKIHQEIDMKPFKCPYCDHRTKEKSAVEKHIRCIHTHETPYKCHFCDQSFKVQSNLQRHIRTHTGFKPYVCKKCGASYADKKNMDAHVFREHLKAKPFYCEQNGCTFRCWRKDRYVLHCDRSHKNKIV